MKTLFARGISILLVFAFVASPIWATCGGGGGGGGGGMAGSGGNSGKNPKPVVYHVPWIKPAQAKAKPVSEGIVLYWFPASSAELRSSPLLESRLLSMYAGQCVSMQLADTTVPNADKLIGESKLPVAVLADLSGAQIDRVENSGGKLKIKEVEDLVTSEIKSREAKVDESLASAKAKASAGNTDAAVELYESVVAQKCMFSKKAKDAARELKKLGVNAADFPVSDPKLDRKTNARIEGLMRRGLVAENNAKYEAADKLYDEARALDPADPTPLRYLGELHRHHIGDWEKAKVEFHQILDMQADPLSRAVALHGLGKITIHEGEFKKGLHLMEDSVSTYPIALAYRNLAVYWNSEGDLAQAGKYTDLALEIDPQDPYNLIFGAVFMAAAGKKDEALKVAAANINVLAASYNLAAIYALSGNRDKALELLKRHFYEYERYHEVRTKEMMEARVDAVFASIVHDQDFLALTKDADGRLPMVMSPKPAGETMKMDN